MVKPTYTVALELTANSFHDVTVWCKQFSYSRELVTAPRNGSVGQGSVVLDNAYAQFTPTNSASPYFPNIRPKMRAKIDATYAGSTYNLFRGYATAFSLNPAFESRYLNIEFHDELSILRDATVTTSLRLNVNPASALAEVFSVTGVGSWYAEQLNETMAFQWFDQHDALNGFRDILAFGGYYGWVDGGGTVQIRNRFWDLRGSSIASLNEAYALPYSLDGDELYNYVRLTGAQYSVASAGSVVAFLVDAQLIPGDGTISFWMNYQDPVTNDVALATDLIFPVASHDYMSNTNSNGGGMDTTSTLSLHLEFFGRSVFTRIYNPGPDETWLTAYQVRGTPLLSRSPVSFTAEAASSQALYGIQKLNMENRFLTDREFLQNYSTYLLQRFRTPNPRIGLTRRDDFPLNLWAEPGNRIHVVNSYLDVRSSFTIVGIDSTVVVEGQIHTTRFMLDGIREGQNVLILDDVDFGILDQRLYGF